MKVTLNVCRLLKKQTDEIVEIFTVTPKKHSMLLDDSRTISFELWKARNDIAIHKFFPMIDIQYYGDKIIYIYKYSQTQENISLFETKDIIYFPMLGKKKCSNCKHKNKNMCTYKGTRINKQMIKCLYWKERDETIMENVCTLQSKTKGISPN